MVGTLGNGECTACPDRCAHIGGHHTNNVVAHIREAPSQPFLLVVRSGVGLGECPPGEGGGGGGGGGGGHTGTLDMVHCSIHAMAGENLKQARHGLNLVAGRKCRGPPPHRL